MTLPLTEIRVPAVAAATTAPVDLPVRSSALPARLGPGSLCLEPQVLGLSHDLEMRWIAAGSNEAEVVNDHALRDRTVGEVPHDPVGPSGPPPVPSAVPVQLHSHRPVAAGVGASGPQSAVLGTGRAQPGQQPRARSFGVDEVERCSDHAGHCDGMILSATQALAGAA